MRHGHLIDRTTQRWVQATGRRIDLSSAPYDGDRVWARYVASLKESIHVYAAENDSVRADHVLTLWGATFLRLHYRLRRA